MVAAEGHDKAASRAPLALPILEMPDVSALALPDVSMAGANAGKAAAEAAASIGVG